MQEIAVLEWIFNGTSLLLLTFELFVVLLSLSDDYIICNDNTGRFDGNYCLLGHVKIDYQINIMFFLGEKVLDNY